MIKISKNDGQKIALTLSDQFCIQRHRQSFNGLISKDIDIAQAYEGDLVYVDFGNRSSFEDPVYLGPVHKGSGAQRYSPPARPSSAYKALAGKKPSSLSTARNTTDQLPIVATSEKDAEAKVIAAFGSRTKYQAWWKKNHKAGRFKGKDANTYLKVVEQYNKLNRATGSSKNMGTGVSLDEAVNRMKSGAQPRCIDASNAKALHKLKERSK